MKIFLSVLFLIYSLSARENPFFPSAGETDIPITSNLIKEIPPLSRTSVSLPSTARTIESVTIKYKTLDGALHEKTENIGSAIDWHIPIFISQNYNVSGSHEECLTEKKEKKYINIFKRKFIAIYEHKNSLKIKSKDKMIRNFLLTKPHRIVCDFSGEINIRSIEKKIKDKSIVKEIRIGNHKGYYRVVIELDGYYRYIVKEKEGEYLFSFL